MSVTELTQNQNIVPFMNKLADAWKAQFPTPPAFDFSFEVRGTDLFLNDELLCPVEDIVPEKSWYEPEYIVLVLKSGKDVRIHILYKFDGSIEVRVINDILSFINDLAELWKEKFDTPPIEDFQFELRDQELYMRGEPLCPAALIDTFKCKCSAERITLQLITGDAVHIHIIARFDGEAVLYPEIVPGQYNAHFYQ